MSTPMPASIDSTEREKALPNAPPAAKKSARKALLIALKAAISLGAVFMGANTYIGNAPNFMVKSVCEERGIRMPSFFGYMLWSGAILLPLFVLVTVVFFR